MRDSLWGAWNALTDHSNHRTTGKGNNAQARFESVLFENGSANKQHARALKFCLQYMGGEIEIEQKAQVFVQSLPPAPAPATGVNARFAGLEF